MHLIHRYKTVYDSGCHKYKECSCGQRKIIKYRGGNQPINAEWLSGGSLKRNTKAPNKD